MKFSLTKEGEEYLENGLPEKRLILLLEENEGKVNLEEARKKIENFNIALIWAKKNNWVKIENNNLILVNKPKKFIEEEALLKIKEGKLNEVSEEIIKILLQRNLIEKVLYEEFEKLKDKEIVVLNSELIKSGYWREVKIKEYSIKIPPQKILVKGKIHPYNKVIREVKEFLISLGFEEASGPLIELNFFNCDVLFMPSDHPAREIHDIFFVEGYGEVEDKSLWKKVKKIHLEKWKSWDENLAKRLILRSHCTAVSVRELLKAKRLPLKIFCIGKVFRPDVIDAKHFIEFEQCEGIVADKNLNFRNLLGYLREIAKIFGAEEVKFKPSYFPFTEPSVEMYVKIENLGWIEAGGAGIFREEVTLPLNVKVPVLAWGLGLGRLAMLKLKIDDIRELYSSNINFLKS